MKYYLLNKEECIKNINTNPILIRTRALGKIKKARALQKKLDVLMKQIRKDLSELNVALTEEKINLLLSGETVEEITNKEYNAMYAIPLYDTQEQRMSSYCKTSIMKGKLYGNEIRLDKD